MAMAAVVTTPPEADAVDKCLELGDSPDFEPRQLPTAAAAADGAGVVELATDLFVSTVTAADDRLEAVRAALPSGLDFFRLRTTSSEGSKSTVRTVPTVGNC